jgi:polyhydroxybutyrate depolymerase
MTRKLIFAAVAGLAFVCAGCGIARAGRSTLEPAGSSSVLLGASIKPYTPPTGRDIDGTLVVSGAVRTYRLYVPASLPDEPVALLVALHGGLGSGAQFEKQSDFDGLAQSNGFIVVYPNGTPIKAGSAMLVWNGGGCCSVADENNEDVDDVGFISDLITTLEGRYDIDKSAVFVTGHSNGAILAERLACQLASQVDAIAIQAGDLFVEGCSPAEPVSVMEIHGTADENIPIDGGRGQKSLTQANFPPPVEGLEALAKGDGCNPDPTSSADPSNSAVTFELWQSCENGTTVEWVKVSGANHAWMGHPTSGATRILVGRAYSGFDSSTAIWEFLAAHPRA